MTNIHDETYINLLNKILTEGFIREERTGVGTISLFGEQMRFKMDDGFPLYTIRKIHKKSLIHELLWFLGAYEDKYKKFGNTNIKYLEDNGVSFWRDWCYDDYKRDFMQTYLSDPNLKKFKLLSIADFGDKIKNDDEFALKYGDLGPVYGKQWINWGGYKENIEVTQESEYTKANTKVVSHLGWENINFKGINQIDNVIDLLLNEPNSRRIIVSAWNVSDLDDMKLEPCHSFFQFYSQLMDIEERNNYAGEFKVNNFNDLNDDEINKLNKLFNDENIPTRKLYLKLYMRSNDYYLGNPFNVASYSLLLHMVAMVVGMIPYEFIWTCGDVHLYNNSISAAKEISTRIPFESPKLIIKRKVDSIYDFRYEDFDFENYQAHPNIHVDVAV